MSLSEETATQPIESHHGATWRVELFGGLRVLCGERVISHFGTRKAGALLAYLAFHPTQLHARETLTEELWPDCAPDVGRNRLRATLSLLKSHLHAPANDALSAVPCCETPLIGQRLGLSINASCFQSDVAVFEQLLQLSATHSIQRDDYLRRAIELYRGPLLAGWYESWIPAQEGRLEELFARALLDLLQSPNVTAQDALQLAQHGLTLLPQHETLHLAVLELYARLNQPAAASRHFWQWEKLLRPHLESSSQHRLILAQLLQSPKTNELAKTKETIRVSEFAPSLPPQSARFFGREAEIAHLKQQLHAPTIVARANVPRLISLLGPGGSGKTRLACEVCWQLSDEWRGRIYWVSLADLHEAHGLDEWVLASLRATLDGATLQNGDASALESAGQRVLDFLRCDKCLLVLDNMEHLLPDAARWVSWLCAQVPHACVLVTSRHRLDLPGEAVFTLSPLPTPQQSRHLQVLADDKTSETPTLFLCDLPAIGSSDEVGHALQFASVQLFCDRAQLARASWQLNAHNVQAVNDVCRHLDGLPLAIELAAARSDVLSPEQMRTRLDAPQEWLHGPVRARDSGHNAALRGDSLQAAMCWSYDLLPPHLQICFRRLGVFRGSFTLEAMRDVTGVGDEIEAAVALRDYSLLLCEAEENCGAMRFRLLETVRHWALQTLQSEGELEAARRDHAHFYAHVAQNAMQQVESPDARVRLQMQKICVQEFDNLLAAFDWCLQHDIEKALPLAEAAQNSQQRFGEIARVIERLLQVHQHCDDSQASDLRLSGLLGMAAEYAQRANDYRRLRELGQRRLELTHHIAWEKPWALFRIACAAQGLDDLDAAREHFQHALQLFQALQSDNPHSLQPAAWTSDKLGEVALNAGDLEQARTYFEDSRAIFERNGDRDGVAGSLCQLSEVAQLENNLSLSRTLLHEATRIERELNDLRPHPRRRLQRAQLELQSGDLPIAREFLNRALSGFARENGLDGVLSVILHLALWELAHGQLHKAAILLCAEDAQRNQRFLPRPRRQHRQQNDAWLGLQELLGETDWQDARERGRVMTLQTLFAWMQNPAA